MGMRLLSAPHGKSQRELDNAQQELRSIELDGVIRAKRKEINDLDVELTKQLTLHGLQNYEEEQLFREKIRGLTEEVAQLEERRKRALVPLDEKATELEDRDRVLSRREELVAIKETDLEHTKEALEDKLDAVSEREQEAVDYATTLNNREFSLNFQEAQLKERMAALTTILQESYTEMETARLEAAKYKAMLKGRDVSITEREQVVQKQVASFENREAALLDKYKTLLRAINETKLNQNGNHDTKRSPRLGNGDKL